MMNLYREEEKAPRESLGQKIKNLKADIKLNWETSALNRKKAIKTVRKAMQNIDVKDVESVQKIRDLVVSLELCSSMYGPALDMAEFEAFVDKLKQNEQLSELETSLRGELNCYPEFRAKKAKEAVQPEEQTGIQPEA